MACKGDELFLATDLNSVIVITPLDICHKFD